MKESQQQSDKKQSSIIVYTDGSCLSNPGRGGWAAVLISGDRRKEISGGAVLSTNNRMEIRAAIESLKAIKASVPKRNVTIYSDSQLLVNTMMKGWAERWKKNNWKRNKSDKAENPDLWDELLSVAATHAVEFVWIKAHVGTPENERCDLLAKQAAENATAHDTYYERNVAGIAAPEPPAKDAKKPSAPAASEVAPSKQLNNEAPQTEKPKKKPAKKSSSKSRSGEEVAPAVQAATPAEITEQPTPNAASKKAKKAAKSSKQSQVTQERASAEAMDTADSHSKHPAPKAKDSQNRQKKSSDLQDDSTRGNASQQQDRNQRNDARNNQRTHSRDSRQDQKQRNNNVQQDSFDGDVNQKQKPNSKQQRVEVSVTKVGGVEHIKIKQGKDYSVLLSFNELPTVLSSIVALVKKSSQ